MKLGGVVRRRRKDPKKLVIITNVSWMSLDYVKANGFSIEMFDLFSLIPTLEKMRKESTKSFLLAEYRDL